LNESLTTIDPSCIIFLVYLYHFSIALGQEERGSLDETTPKKNLLSVKSKFVLQDDVPKSPLTAVNVITDPDAKVHEKSEWINEDSCYICERALEKLKGVNPHHW